MDMKFPFPADPEKWQAAYTADNAYYDAGPISSIAPLIRTASLVTALLFSIAFLFSNFPAKQFLFSLDPGLADDLDAGQLTDPVREAFQNHDKPLPPTATVGVEQAGSEWVINDADTQYLIRNEGQTLNVHIKQNRLIAFITLVVMVITAALVYVMFKQVEKIALRHAKKFFGEFYLPPESIDPAEVINYRLNNRIKLPMPFSEWFPSISQFKYILVQNGNFLKKNDWPVWLACNIGGPILLIVFDGSALYIERGNRFSRVVGPGVSFLERYETIKYAVDLRTKVKEIKEDKDRMEVWTKDGIIVKLKLHIEYRIGDPQKISAKPQLIYPYDPVAVKKAIERYSLRWPDPTKEPGEFTWEDAAWGQVTSIIPNYIGSRFLDDLLVADRKGGQILSPDAADEIFNDLNKATNVFGVYVTDFQILSIEVPPEVEEYYVQYWEAERQSIATIMDGKAKAFNIRAREKVRAGAQHDLILAIADGLKKNENENGRLTEALLLSLSEILDHGLSDPYMRSYTAKETLETLEKLQSMLEKPWP